MNHFKGVVPEELWKNDLLNEVRMIRQLLERNGQAFEPPAEECKPERKRPGRRKRSEEG